MLCYHKKEPGKLFLRIIFADRGTDFEIWRGSQDLLFNGNRFIDDPSDLRNIGDGIALGFDAWSYGHSMSLRGCCGSS